MSVAGLECGVTASPCASTCSGGHTKDDRPVSSAESQAQGSEEPVSG